jgi:pimeloyl-ACP methyl ester carboxylesterase
MPTRKWDLPHGVNTFNVNGYDMAYLEYGQGVPLVLIHGSLNDFRVWKFQMKAPTCAA